MPYASSVSMRYQNYITTGKNIKYSKRYQIGIDNGYGCRYNIDINKSSRGGSDEVFDQRSGLSAQGHEGDRPSARANAYGFNSGDSVGLDKERDRSDAKVIQGYMPVPKPTIEWKQCNMVTEYQRREAAECTEALPVDRTEDSSGHEPGEGMTNTPWRPSCSKTNSWSPAPRKVLMDWTSEPTETAWDERGVPRKERIRDYLPHLEKGRWRRILHQMFRALRVVAYNRLGRAEKTIS